MSEPALCLYPTEAAAKRAGLSLSSLSDERFATVLYALQSAEGKRTYLLSGSYRLTVAERRWAEEHQATVIKLGRFLVGGSFMPLQDNMVRHQKARRDSPE